MFENAAGFCEMTLKYLSSTWPKYGTCSEGQRNHSAFNLTFMLLVVTTNSFCGTEEDFKI